MVVCYSDIFKELTVQLKRYTLQMVNSSERILHSIQSIFTTVSLPLVFFFLNSNSITSPRKSLRKNYIVNYDRMEFKIEIELSFGLLTGRITKKLAYKLEI